MKEKLKNSLTISEKDKKLLVYVFTDATITAPTNMSYTHGDTFNPTGLSVTIKTSSHPTGTTYTVTGTEGNYKWDTDSRK